VGVSSITSFVARSDGDGRVMLSCVSIYLGEGFASFLARRERRMPP